ncbi:MAG: thioredoxin family protein [Clostridium sp.]|nr:thioredoxin family protein [Clostridium sp.]
MNNDANKPKNNIVKIGVPLIIISALIVMWFLKTQQYPKESAETSPPVHTNPDFAFDVENELNLDRLKTYGLPIMIDFGADYCPPCREIKPTLVKLNAELQEKAIIRYVDVQKLPGVAQDFPVQVIPTQVFYDKEGKPYKPSDQNSSKMRTYLDRNTEEHIFTTHEGIMTYEEILTILREMGMEE